MPDLGTTLPGYVNKHGQVVIRNTGLPGTDHLQSTYQLGCSACGHVYGANGSDIHERKCPHCDRGAKGLPLGSPESKKSPDGFPRRIILSRKGFDQSSGGCPSLILPDGTLLSIPIPEDNRHTVRSTFEMLGHQRGQALPRAINTSPGRQIRLDGPVHLDPDIRPDIRPTLAEPGHENFLVYGQDGGFQTHLASEGVGAGDLFLFFGLFRRATILGDTAVFDRNAGMQHVIWGWLQVDQAQRVPDGAVPPHLELLRHHPHLDDPNRDNNCVYLGRQTLSFCDRVPGAGIFRRYHDSLRLTTPGEYRPSFWSLPAFFADAGMTFHRLYEWERHNGSIRGQSVGRGQEFVLRTHGVESEARIWLESLFQHAEKMNES